jgi:hypothetical protein
VESLRLDGSDARAVMAQCGQRLAQAFDTVPTRDIPSVSRELRTSLSWLAEAAAGVDGLAEIRSRRLLHRTDSILSEVDRQRALHRVAEFEDEGA